MNIREATASDANDLTGLYRLLKEDPGIAVKPARLDQLRANPQSFLMVCEIDGKTIGTAHISLCPDAMYGDQPFGIVENIVVAEEFRARGVGRALMNHVDELCFSLGCSKIMLLSNAKRHNAHRFFTQRGYSASRKVGFVKYRSKHNR